MYVQIVKLKLRADASRESFLDLAEQMIAWLKNRPGFIAYELYEGAEFWSDRIAWENKAFAQDGLKDFADTALAQKLIQLVEDGYSSFFGQAVVSTRFEHERSLNPGRME